ncbi:MAG: hypothetical protein FWG65_13050 [Turicibacter sp.]|nr:hypothetical protein [Turicibacter sp.]
MKLSFKVMFMRNKELITPSPLDVELNNQNRGDIRQYQYINSFHCFKLSKPHNINTRGIENSDDYAVEANKFLEVHDGKRLISLAYIFINSDTGNIYAHNCPKTTLNKILLI